MKRPRGTSDAPIVDPAPTSAATAPVQWQPPFTRFPYSRGDVLSGEPVPCVPSPADVAGRLMRLIVRRMQALTRMANTRALGADFHAAARTELAVWCKEISRRVYAELSPRRKKGGG